MSESEKAKERKGTTSEGGKKRMVSKEKMVVSE